MTIPRSEEENVRNCRRLLSMVSELHDMGYQQLRIAPAVAPSGLFWRLSICAASNTRPDHGAEMQVWDKGVHYSSGGGDEYFGWRDTANDSPKELAQKFVERFPDLATEGKGDDPDYARWYKEMLEVTEPDGLLCAYADWPVPRDRLTLFHGSMDVEISLPPPAVGSN